MPQPNNHALRLSVDGQIQVMRSLEEAATFVRRHPMGQHAGSLLDQIEGAANSRLTAQAWVAVATFADAMQRSGSVTLTRSA
ncbi:MULTISPECIES: hypothetical protein [unclassified Xanthobacter]|uniref:hypothetical protein n=1 Tax=unclassified Xanthobacter TaxID=2623496 RepID=UPI001EE0BE25|nr:MULTISPECIES: hypothetical protein [unclassified Xanthobacter]